jgi:hypothetical protein
MSRLVAVSFVFAAACSGGEPVKSTGTPVPAVSPTDKGVSQNTEKSAGDAANERTAAKSPGPVLSLPTGSRKSSGVPGPIDPAWFRDDLFAGATVTTAGRTQKDEQGLFTTQMRFALAAGTTVAACLEVFEAALKGALPSYTREEGEDGRVTLRGSNADYDVIAICGTAKGEPSAYVSYRWLRAPTPGPAPTPAPAPISTPMPTTTH